MYRTCDNLCRSLGCQPIGRAAALPLDAAQQWPVVVSTCAGPSESQQSFRPDRTSLDCAQVLQPSHDSNAPCSM